MLDEQRNKKALKEGRRRRQELEDQKDHTDDLLLEDEKTYDMHGMLTVKIYYAFYYITIRSLPNINLKNVSFL